MSSTSIDAESPNIMHLVASAIDFIKKSPDEIDTILSGIIQHLKLFAYNREDLADKLSTAVATIESATGHRTSSHAISSEIARLTTASATSHGDGELFLMTFLRRANASAQ